MEVSGAGFVLLVVASGSLSSDLPVHAVQTKSADGVSEFLPLWCV
jgi:hypothetical protein